MERRFDGAGRSCARAAKVSLVAAMLAVGGNAAVVDSSAEAGWSWFKKRGDKADKRAKRRALIRKQSGRKQSSRKQSERNPAKSSVKSRSASTRSAAPASRSKSTRARQIAIFGDSLGDGMYVGLTRLTSTNSNVSVRKFSRMNTGLTRRDRYDWNAAATRLSRQKMHAAVLVFGANDTHPIREGGRTHAFRSKAWEKLYMKRAARIVRTFRKRRIRTYLVGLPITRADRFQDDYAYLNRIFRRVAKRNGARYIDNWSKFADGRGRFTPFYTVDGRKQRIRAQDGVHFTMDGYRYYAKNTHARLKRDLRF